MQAIPSTEEEDRHVCLNRDGGQLSRKKMELEEEEEEEERSWRCVGRLVIGAGTPVRLKRQGRHFPPYCYCNKYHGNDSCCWIRAAVM